MSDRERTEVTELYKKFPEFEGAGLDASKTRTEKLEAIGIIAPGADAAVAEPTQDPALKFSEAELEFLARPVTDLQDLSTQGQNTLRNNGINYIYQLLAQYEAEMVRNHFGKTSRDQAKTNLERIANESDVASLLADSRLLTNYKDAKICRKFAESQLFDGLAESDHSTIEINQYHPDDTSYSFTGKENYAQKSLDALREAGVFTAKESLAPVKLDFQEVHSPKTLKEEEAGQVSVSSGVILASDHSKDMDAVARQLTTALRASDGFDYDVTRLGRSEQGQYRLHISDSCLDKLVELGAKVDVSAGQAAAAGQSR